MKRITLFGLLIVTLSLLLASCGGKKEEPVVEAPPPVVTKPAEPAKTEPEPEPAPMMLKQEQLATLYFDYDKFNLRSDAKAALDANYELLKQFPKTVIKIEGHCDERGTIEYNLVLGEKRARAAMDYLVGLGIDQSRLSIISYGKERPAVPGSNEAAWSKNRRDEFRIVSQ